ncbi:hypothetical protein LB566_15635 [Mesorhizobium sp. CA13]|uniref:hypothetical protein n=1 Tax=unclassified Mesorhizobium TaxID=325217 RepID=UPI001CC9EE90|nr:MULTISPECIES: hypothetical protein [unclassified Mesorhizobium]MBZ9855238.1 hypothetical protein [Mesorhizobium sp. CA13]MBZ9966312.1 hypothetical protein [Mesorhizobium sp. BR1-1-2]
MMSLLRATLMLAAFAASSNLSFGTEALPIRKRPVSDYAALRDRPLFSPNRTAPIPFAAAEPEPVVMPPEPEPEPPPAAAPDWQLVGIVRSERLNSATFTTPAELAAFTLRTGESREGWTLKAVGQFEVKLDGAGGRASLRFSDEASGEQMLPPEEPVPTPSGG